MRYRMTVMFALLLVGSFMIAPDFASASSVASAGQRTYTVQPGDSLSKIAARVGLPSWQTLYAANRDRIRNPHVIFAGQVLVLPGGNGAAVPAPAAAAPRSAAPAAGNSNMINVITAAANRYGQSPAAMISVARCESSLNPNAVNRSSGASGLFQFMPGTWRTTPYANANIFNAESNANAAAWMWSVGRQREWVCKP